MFSCLILVFILLWWAEARFNYLYVIVEAMKKCCDWIKKQTKLRIDICKWVIPLILLFGMFYVLWSTIYSPYLNETTDFKNGVLSIKVYPQKDSELNEVDENKNIKNEEKTNPIGDWGTFGDFIGGTLNPIIGLISILLLFATWRLTSSTFKSTDSALRSQQFDSWFFNLLQGFQAINHKYTEHVEKEDFYRKLFLDKESNLALSKDVLFIQYFSSLNVILKLINTKLKFVGNKEKQNELKLFYIDIILAQISNEILQLLAWYAFHDDDLKKSLEDAGFFKSLDFIYYIDSQNNLFASYNFELLSNLHRYNEKIFQNSQNFLDLKKYYLYEFFFSNGTLLAQFFKKQYTQKIQLIIESRLPMMPSCTLILIFGEDNLEIYEVDNNNQNKRINKIEYKNMTYINYSINFNYSGSTFSIENGNLNKLKILNSDFHIIKDLSVM